jgi:hypothetical protein
MPLGKVVFLATTVVTKPAEGSIAVRIFGTHLDASSYSFPRLAVEKCESTAKATFLC